jgi:hypothetical protein
MDKSPQTRHHTVLFPPVRETLHAGRVKLFPEASALLTHAVFQLFVFQKTASPESAPQGAKKVEVVGCLLGLWGG